MYKATERQKQLKQKALNLEIDSRLVQENFQKELSKIHRNANEKQIGRQSQDEKMEMAYEDAIRKTEQMSIQRMRENEEDQRIARELYETNRKRINEEKLRQQLRESNHELKELGSKLRAAYVAKGLAAQKAEIEAMKLQQKLDDQREREMLEQARLENVEFTKKSEEEERKRKQELKEVLKHQINTAYRQKQRLYEEFLKEKSYLDEIVQRIQDEHLENLRLQMEQKERTRREMEYFKEAQEIWKEKQRLALEEENQRIKEYCLEKDKDQNEKLVQRMESERVRCELNERMVAELSEAMEEARKREEILQDLYAVEVSEKENQKIREDMEIQLRKRIETRIALDRQKMEQQCQKEREASEEQQFREDQMQLLAERDKIDLMSNEKRRRKMMEHRKAIHELLEDRNQRRADEVAGMMRMREMHEREEKRRDELIEEERIKMLKEHAAALIGFLPPGVLRESDREHIPIPRK